MIRSLQPTPARRIIADALLAAAAAAVAVFLCLGYAQTAQAAAPASHSDYSDIEEGGISFHGAVDYLIEQGVLTYDTGCDATDTEKFCPDDEMPRWQVIVWMVRAYGAVNNESFDDSTPAKKVFADVDVDEWWAPYVSRAEELGITGGCGTDGSGEKIFCPDQTASRAQMATMIKRAFNVSKTTETDVFADVEPGDTHAGAIDDIAGAGITTGCTRKAQIVDSKIATGETKQDAETFYEENKDERFYCPYKSPKQQMACLLARAMSEDRPIDCSPAARADAPAAAAVAGGKDGGGEEVPGAGARNNLALGSVFAGLLTLSVIYGRIYLDARKRQNAPR